MSRGTSVNYKWDREWSSVILGHSNQMIKEYSAGAVLYGYFENDERRFLLLHYISGHWDFPKGNVEAKETEVDTVIREIFEETGIADLRFADGFVQPIFYEYKRNGNLVRKKVMFYLAKTSTKKVKLSNEHQGFLWADYDSALKTLTYRNAKDILTAANTIIDGGKVT